jgi:hypothetical protein
MKNDILMFHRLMRAMPLNREMSLGDICRAVQEDGGPAVEQWDSSIRRALLIDENDYFASRDGDRWRRVQDYKPIGFGGV